MYDDFRRFSEEMNRMIEEMWGSPSRRLMLPTGERALEKTGYRRPFADLIESEKELTATVEMPGLRKEDIDINLTPETLEISAESKHEEERKEKDYVYRERRGESFYRSMTLPSRVDPDTTKASYNNGVLEIKMPKIEIKQKKPLKIE